MNDLPLHLVVDVLAEVKGPCLKCGASFGPDRTSRTMRATHDEEYWKAQPDNCVTGQFRKDE